MSNLPSKFTIPKDRIPKPWKQGVYDCCVAASITKVLEVINYVRTGTYIMLSKGYVYGRHNRPDKRQGGMDHEYTIPKILERGSVPEEMYPHMNEMPNIMDDVAKHPDIAELDKAAEETKIKAFTQFKGNIYFYDNVKKCLYEHQMPLVGNMVGKRHSVVIVGWDGDKLLYHDHDGSDKFYKGKFNEAYYLDGGIEEMSKFKSFNKDTFKEYIDTLKVTRGISRVQLHHTYSPSYKDFTGSNHEALQNGMRNYHVNTNEWADIGQHFTIFPDGVIMTGRDIETKPAGIYGANTGAICIECLGNFDIGGDVMTEEQKEAIVAVTKILLDKFGLSAADDVTYHAGWGADGREIGDYVKSASVKTCPGTNFFGGNGLTAYRNNLQPLIENYGKAEQKMLETGNDMVWELMNGKLKVEITEVQRAVKALDEAKKNANFSSLYWIIYKIVNGNR